MAASQGDELRSVAAWYKSSRHLRVDIVGDFAGQELFVVHGESMMMHCLSQAQVDFGNGFQLLHAVHAVEQFLENLRSRRCNFHIAWFKDHRDLCYNDRVDGDVVYKYQLTRKILIKHFALNPSATSVEFPSMNSPEWSGYLGANAVHFILCSDGLRYNDKKRAIRYQEILCRMSLRGYSVATIDDVEFKSSKVYASVISPAKRPTDLGAMESDPEYCPQDEILENMMSRLDGLGLTSWSPWEGGKLPTGRDVATVIALARRLEADNTPDTKNRAVVMLIQLVVLRYTNLSARLFDNTSLSKPALVLHNQFLSGFSADVAKILDMWDEKYASHLTWDLYDLVDGRLLSHIVGGLGTLSLPRARSTELRQLAQRIQDLTNVDLLGDLPGNLVLDSEPDPGINSLTLEDQTTQIPTAAVLPFRHPVLDPFMNKIHVRADASLEPSTRSAIFEELSHWHNSKNSLDPRQRRKPPGFFARKRNQKYMADTIAYSASLINASGKNIDPEPVIVAKSTGKPSRRGQGPKGGDKPAQQAVQSLQQAKDQKRAASVLAFWEEQCRHFDRDDDPAQRYIKAAKFLSELPKPSADIVGCEVTLYMCNALASIIAESEEEEPGVMALLWSHVKTMSDRALPKQCLDGFESFADIFEIPFEATVDGGSPRHRLPFTSFPDLDVDFDLPTSALEFQLRHCGPYLERTFDSQPDPRVPFEPDAWQRRVLDAIDEDKSLFVVAPTSAGKTFISFYAMKKALQASDDDVLVYVAPTKALVNQIAAEIQARYRKTYKNGGKSVWAIHTRDYRVNNPSGCQVLVTVPHVLQIMLLAPSNANKANSWANRVKRIIFDEIHSIGQAEDGVVWEQLLLLAPCPIIALSATVGNPLEFRDWLQGSQKAKGFDMEMIVHQARYSDLRKFFHHAPKKLIFTGLKSEARLGIPGLDQQDRDRSRFSAIHPVATLVNRNRDTLDDLAFEPRDCLELWLCMKKHQNRKFPLSSDLDPAKSLPEFPGKSDVLKWEAALKASLQRWMRDLESPFSKVQEEFRTKFEKPKNGSLRVAGATSDHPDGIATTFHVPSNSTPESHTYSTALALLSDLQKLGALPALLFNYDRSGCEQLVNMLNYQLFQAEKNWKEKSSEWKKTMEQYNNWKKAQSKVKSRPAVTKKPAKGGDSDGMSKMDQIREEASRQSSPWEKFRERDPLARFSFADEKNVSRSELEERIRSLPQDKVPRRIIDALRRGIGIHHAGMNREYRQVVEILFRRGFLTVVVATGTLALGINMPCKTVVFTGDSVFLTALNYLQAAGRAGRRGFDILGNVVFHGINPNRVCEVMSSRLPDLRGHFPVSTTLVLRVMTLLSGTNNSAYSVKAVESMLSQTRLYLGGSAAQQTIQHHLRFSIEYLRRQQLLSIKGSPLNFAGLVGHLYFTENAVFAFHALLKAGYFHDVCRGIHDNPKDVLLELVLVLAHLFARIPCQRFMDQARIEDVVHRSPSVVFLPRLPDRAEDTLRDHNRETLDIFRAYVGSYVHQHLSDVVDCELPFTKHRISAAAELSPAIDGIPGQRPPTLLRSPFTALSGFNDTFVSIKELCSTVRSGVFLEDSAVPYIPLYPDDTEGVPMNAYIYDFFKHGDLRALEEDNGIKRSDVWFSLKDFSLVIATIVTSLANYLGTCAVDDSDMIEVQDGSEEVGDQDEDDLPPPSSTSQGNLGTQQSSEMPKTKKKPKKEALLDSWEDGDVSSEEDSGSEAGTGQGADASASAWDGQEARGLVQVYQAFVMLQNEFDTKFKKIGA